MASNLITWGFLLFATFPLRAYAFNWEERLAWDTSQVSYALDSSIPRPWRPAIHRAARCWSQSGARFAFIYDSTSTNLLCLKSLSSGLVSITEIHHQPGETAIRRCATHFNKGKGFSPKGRPATHEYDLETVALHEFGHWLKLGHVANPDCVMYDSLYPERMKRELSFDEREGIRAIYPPRP